jgi:hypothetical protein
MQSTSQKPPGSMDPGASDPERGLPARINELRRALAGEEPYSLAQRCGATFCGPILPAEESLGVCGMFTFRLWGRAVHVSYPGYEASWQPENSPLGLLEQGLLAYYLARCDGTPPAGRWISFSELPDGRFYNQAFQGYTGDVLGRAFSDQIEGFTGRALAMGGEPFNLGEAAFAFQALPRVPVLAVAWLGDEDFPTRYQVLFDASVSHHLPTDGCAILGSMLVRRLLKG